MLTFKDGRELRFVDGGDGGKEGVMDLGQCKIGDVVEEVDRRSRVMRRREDLAG